MLRIKVGGLGLRRARVRVRSGAARTAERNDRDPGRAGPSRPAGTGRADNALIYAPP